MNQLQQVLLNLSLNACAAMPQGGRLTIGTAAADGMVTMKVSDTGCGIKEEHLDQHFRAVFHHAGGRQGNRAGTERHLRHRRTARRPEWRSKAKRVREARSRSISAAAKENTMSKDASGRETAAVALRILVIDDESVIGLSCQRTLGAEGHEVQYFQDPQAGLQAALSGDWDVVLVDLMMPGISGMEILRQIKAAGVPSEVVIITGHATVESAVDAMKQGPHDYLSKPFSPAQLKMAVQQGLGAFAA